MKDQFQMYGKVELITPQRAQELLDSVIVNRSLKPGNLGKIKRSIISGSFIPTHQGIAIDEDGHMFDGSHRCKAIVETGIATEMFVVYNAPNTTGIDSGAVRSERDQLYMAGMIDKDSGIYKNMGMALLNTILRRNYLESEVRTMDTFEKYRVYYSHKTLIDKTIGCLYSNLFCNSCILYAMACALKSGVSEETLKDWHRILVTGDFYNADKKVMLAGRSILRFREAAEQMRRANLSHATDDAITLIKKAMSSIDYFDRKEPISKIYGSFVYPEIKLGRAA